MTYTSAIIKFIQVRYRHSLDPSPSKGQRSWGGVAVRRTYKFLLRPTRRQEAALSACLEGTRQLYNAALEER